MTDSTRVTQLGTGGPQVFPIALGCMAMSGAYGQADDNESVNTIREVWVLAKQPTLVPVMGARTRPQLLDVLGALDKPLSADDVAAVEAILPKDAITGTRYPEQQMKLLDSER